jgi:hypothetical protein
VLLLEVVLLNWLLCSSFPVSILWRRIWCGSRTVLRMLLLLLLAAPGAAAVLQGTHAAVCQAPATESISYCCCCRQGIRM